LAFKSLVVAKHVLQYLVLTLGDARQATSTINRTLNPEWNQSIELPIAGVQSAVLEAVCWDKDRFGKDYMGEFEIILEDLFADGAIERDPKWFPLTSKRTGKKSSVVTGAIQLQFSLADPSNPSANPQQLIQKLSTLIGSGLPDFGAEDDLQEGDEGEEGDDSDKLALDEQETPPDNDGTPETEEKKKRRLRIARLKKKAKLQGYEFTNGSAVAGVLFIEIQKINDLPPERNGKLSRRIEACNHLTQPSYSNFFRYGSICCDLPRPKDLPYPRYQTQSEPGVRREARFPSYEKRDELLNLLHRHRSRQLLWKRLCRTRVFAIGQGHRFGSRGGYPDRTIHPSRVARWCFNSHSRGKQEI
jgi:hypothetical protein